MKKITLIAAIIILLSTALPAMGGGTATEPPSKPGKKEKCPVCGMFVYKYPDWIAAIVLPTGEDLYFDGAKDMFRYLKDNPGNDAVAWVTEYYGLRMIEARKAFYVLGSDVYGPMGHELVPFATRQEAGEFKADHKGKRVLTYEEVDAAILKGLN